MEWLTLGLLVFAAVQVWVPYWTERNRLKERRYDEEVKREDLKREADRDYQVVWAERLRLDQLAAWWQKEDLVLLSAFGSLNSDDVLPRDWSTVFSALSRLSIEAGYFGGLAVSLAHDISKEIVSLNAVVDSVKQQHPDLSHQELSNMVRENHGEYAGGLEATIQALSADMALLILDAVRHYQGYHVGREFHFSDDIKSNFGRRAVQEINAIRERLEREVVEKLEAALKEDSRQ